MIDRSKPAVLHVATINHPIRPNLGYAPIESVIHDISTGLYLSGHRTIVACSGDSLVSGEHCVTVERSIGAYCSDKTRASHRIMREHYAKALRRAKRGDIDIIHMHDADAVEFMYDSAFEMNIPIVMTLHVDANESHMQGGYQRWCSPLLQLPMVNCTAISDFQKRQYGTVANARDVVHHGLDVSGYPVKEVPDKESYLFTIGRVTPDKGQDKAIRIALETGCKLIIAGCVQNKHADREFFRQLQGDIDLSVEVGKEPAGDDYYVRVIKPLMDSDRQIIYIGEINAEHKKHWYRHARATLFPIQWGEPFGLVLIESMACGTPVIAMNKGSVPEIIADGRTGFVVDSVGAMVEAMGVIDNIKPRDCREHVERHFSLKSMALKYSMLYSRILCEHQAPDTHSSLSSGYRLNAMQPAAPTA